MRYPEPPVTISHLASRVAVLTDESYESAMRVIKALFILMAQLKPAQVKQLLAKYKKFQGTVPYDIDKVHE